MPKLKRFRCLKPIIIIFVSIFIIYYIINYNTDLINIADEDKMLTSDILKRKIRSDFNEKKLYKFQSQSSIKQEKSINLDEMMKISYQMLGYTYARHGVSYKCWATITTGLLHSFSPYIENEAAKRHLDPAGGNSYYANSPAITWFNNELVLVSRIWLNRELYERNKAWPPNSFPDNVLYTQKFDNQLRPISNGSLLGIPLPKNGWVGDGPIEPRIFTFKDKLYVTFNAAVHFDKSQLLDFTFFFDYIKSIPIVPSIKGDTPMKKTVPSGEIPRDKHWMPFVKKNSLYFVHCLDPLRVMKCRPDIGYCSFVYKQDTIANETFKFDRHKAPLRGGTPLQKYAYPYYVSIVHSTLYKKKNHKRYYSAHVLIFDVEHYRIVYLSDVIKMKQEILDRIPMVRPYMEDSFIFPVSLILENKDSWIIGAHINDHDSILLRMRGMKTLIDLAIKFDQRIKPRKGPASGFLHSHIKDIVKEQSKIEFE